MKLDIWCPQMMSQSIQGVEGLSMSPKWKDLVAKWLPTSGIVGGNMSGSWLNPDDRTVDDCWWDCPHYRTVQCQCRPTSATGNGQSHKEVNQIAYGPSFVGIAGRDTGGAKGVVSVSVAGIDASDNTCHSSALILP